MIKRLIFLAAVTLLLSAFAYADAQKFITATADIGEDGVQRVALTGGEYYFEPNRIILKVNVPTEFLVSKPPGFVPHNIIIDAPEAGMSFKGDFNKKGEIIKFTPTRVGTYPFYCDKKLLFFKSHREKGMHGVIEVVR